MKLKIALVAASFFNWWEKVKRLFSLLHSVAAFLFK